MNRNHITIFFAGVGIGAAVIVGATSLLSENTVLYKQGQIDALTGKVKFELKTQTDGTKIWQRK